MITESMMYWITRLDAINLALGVGLILNIGILLFLLADYEWDLLQHKPSWRCIIIAFVCAMGLVFVPTTKEMAMIYAVPAITRSDFVQKDLPELYDMGIKALKEQLNTEK